MKNNIKNTLKIGNIKPQDDLFRNTSVQETIPEEKKQGETVVEKYPEQCLIRMTTEQKDFISALARQVQRTRTTKEHSFSYHDIIRALINLLPQDVTLSNCGINSEEDLVRVLKEKLS